MIELARRTGGIVAGDGLRQAFRVQPQLASQLFNGIGLAPGKTGGIKWPIALLSMIE